MPKYRNKGKRLFYQKSDVRSALVARAHFKLQGKPIAEMDVSTLAYWVLSAVNPHSRLGCLAMLLEKTNHGHVVRGLLLSLDTYEKESDNGEEKHTERLGIEAGGSSGGECSGTDQAIQD